MVKEKETKEETPETRRDAALIRVQEAYEQRVHTLNTSHNCYEFSVELCRKLFAEELHRVEEIYQKEIKRST